MVPPKVQAGQTRVRLQIQVRDEHNDVVDLSTSSLLRVVLRGPFGASKVNSGTLTNTGEDGLLYYETVADDLDSVGMWSIQAYIELSSGERFHTEVGRLYVEANS